MSFLADVGRSNAGQVGQGIFSDLMKYKQMERQGERDAMTTVAQAQQMDIARKGAEIQQAKELRDKAEFDAKQKEANRRLPLTLRWGPMESWSESKKAIIAEGRAMGLVEDVGGVPTASPNDYKTFIESLDPAKAVNISAMNLSEHAADMGEIQRKLAAKPGDEKLITERDRIVGLYTQQKEKHDELVNALAMDKPTVYKPGDFVKQADGSFMQMPMKPTDHWVDENRVIDGKKVEGQRNPTTNEWKQRAQGQNISINMPTQEEATSIVQMVHDNGLDPTQIPKRGGVWNKAMAEWKKQYPNENINDYAAFAKWKRDTSVNKSMTLLDSIEPMLVEMEKLHGELGLSNFKDLNKMKVWIKDHTGDPKVARYETLMRNVVQELPPAMTGYFPTDTRITMELKNLETPRAPAQIGASIGAVRDLVRVRRQQFFAPSWSPLMKNQRTVTPSGTGSKFKIISVE